MSTLADSVLPLIRTRADLHRWSASSAHGRQMHQAIDILEADAATADPAELYAVTHKALASAIKVIARADDSGGVIGEACRRLLAMHPKVATRAGVASDERPASGARRLMDSGSVPDASGRKVGRTFWVRADAGLGRFGHPTPRRPRHLHKSHGCPAHAAWISLAGFHCITHAWHDGTEPPADPRPWAVLLRCWQPG